MTRYVLNSNQRRSYANSYIVVHATLCLNHSIMLYFTYRAWENIGGEKIGEFGEL